MKSSIQFLLAACIFFSLTGCERDPHDEPEHTVSINFTVGSMLKSTATPAENAVDEILLFTLDSDNKVVKHPIIQLSGAELTISKKVKWFYAIANPTTTLKNQNPASVTDLEDLTWDFQTALTPTSKFPMSGKQEYSGTKSISIELVRLVAKINITTSDTKFTDISLAVTTPRYGYIFARTPLSVPNASTRVTYNFSNFNSPVYVAENVGTSNLTRFVVNGKYEGNAINPALDFNLREGTQGINIVRNTCYEVPISFQYAN